MINRKESQLIAQELKNLGGRQQKKNRISSTQKSERGKRIAKGLSLR